MNLTDGIWQAMSSLTYGAYATRPEVERELASWPDAPALTVTLEEAEEICVKYYDGSPSMGRHRSLREAIISVLARRPAAQAQEPHISVMPAEQERHEFENFHRALCERFGYCHDPVDWKRDQVSLIEHIASLIPASTPEQRIEAEGDVVNKMLTAYDLAYKPEVGGHNHAMRAAYAVSRQHFAAHPPEGSFTKEQVEKAVIEEFIDAALREAGETV